MRVQGSGSRVQGYGLWVKVNYRPRNFHPPVEADLPGMDLLVRVRDRVKG